MMHDSYNFQRGQILVRKYEVMQQLRHGHLGELYQLHERSTGIERTAKFFPSRLRHSGSQLARNYALKLHRLRDCDILMPYRTHETFSYQGQEVTFLVSDCVEGELLHRFLARQAGGHLSPFAGLHLLHALAIGVEKMHTAKEHHGDLTTANVMVKRQGLNFRVKLLDLDPRPLAKPAIIKQDVADLISLFKAATAWQRTCKRQSRPLNCVGAALPKLYAAGKFKNAGDLRRHLECLSWS